MKRIAGLVLLAGVASGAAVWISLSHGPAPAAVGLESEPLNARVSRAIRNPQRAPAALASARHRDPRFVRLEATRACIQRDDCSYPNTDPREYEFAVARDLAAQARALRESLIGDPSAQEELELAAQELVQVDDGHVQEEAIKIFSALPPRSENLQAMIVGLHNSPDATVVAQAMEEWKRYLGTGDERLVQEAVAEIVARGAQFTAEQASADVGEFLNERTVQSFRDALAGMIPSSTAAQNLRAALEQYDRRVMGG